MWYEVLHWPERSVRGDGSQVARPTGVQACIVRNLLRESGLGLTSLEKLAPSGIEL